MKGRKLPAILIVLLLANILVWSLVRADFEGRAFSVRFLDVGQGDAILISQGSRQLLIDAGPDARILEKLGRFMPFYDRKIELVALTHPDLDHIGGMRWVLERYRVERALVTGAYQGSRGYRRILELLDREGAEIYPAGLGTVAELGPEAGLIVLWPDRPLLGKKPDYSNEGSMVAKLIIGRRRFLLTGDAERVVELALIRAGWDLEADVLKVGHHGAGRGTSRLFLEAVRPRAAVISVGRNNPYGHPAPAVLENLTGLPVFRTDCHGDISFRTNGRALELKTSRPGC